LLVTLRENGCRYSVGRPYGNLSHGAEERVLILDPTLQRRRADIRFPCELHELISQNFVYGTTSRRQNGYSGDVGIHDSQLKRNQAPLTVADQDRVNSSRLRMGTPERQCARGITNNLAKTGVARVFSEFGAAGAALIEPQ